MLSASAICFLCTACVDLPTSLVFIRSISRFLAACLFLRFLWALLLWLSISVVLNRGAGAKEAISSFGRFFMSSPMNRRGSLANE